MFIFDAGQPKEKIHGMRISKCEVCKKQTPHNLLEVGFFVTALETPILPYKRRYLFPCQRCGSGKELTKKEFEKLRQHRDLEEIKSYNQPYEYEMTKEQGKKFCIFCGDKLKAGAKFCNNCGKSVKKKKKKKRK